MCHKAIVWHVASFLLSLAVLPALGQTTNWKHDPASAGNWFDLTNWTNGLPGGYPTVEGCIANGGTASIASGTINTTGLYVASGGSGSVTQAGGSAHFGRIDLGSFGGHGTYTLNSGTLSGDVQFIGIWQSAVGLFIQNGGSNTVGSYIWLGRYQSNGSYQLNNGYLAAETIRVGDNSSSAQGTFVQTGGQNEINAELRLESGSYTLQGGTLHFSSYGSLSMYEKGIFTQSGGTNTVEGSMFMGGTYTLSRGTCLGTTLYIAGGKLEVAGGQLRAQQIRIGSGTGSSLIVSNPSADIQVTSSLYVKSDGRITAAPGSAIRMFGSSFLNESTTPSALADLRNLTMTFEGNPAAASSVEVAGNDVGAMVGGFEGNFALGTLQIGGISGAGQVCLMDSFRNQTSGTRPESLYVDQLVLGAGSHLDLNGLNLYYNHYINNGGTITLNGGSMTLVPEPGTLSLLALGGLALIRRRR